MTGSSAVRRSPLAGVALPPGMREVPFLAQVLLRADPGDTDVMTRLAQALDLSLPVIANRVSGSHDLHALWLGPDEWLIVGQPGSESALEAGCRTALGTAFGSVVDVSANRAVIELGGPFARQILESGCSIDLHPRAFGAGHCAQTLLARTGVILHQLTTEPLYRLLVRPSFAIHVAAWLRDAGALLHDT
ncbi:MAG: sarcosine oxidase subunit gamma family protein [Vicinamibacterales bacterium]